MVYSLIFIGLTTLVLITGLVLMATGSNLAKKYSTKLMSLRVLFQALAIISLLIIYYLYK